MRKMRYLYYVLFSVLTFFTACDVHEWPEEEEEPEKEIVRINLFFQTDMEEKNHFYDARSAGTTRGYEMRYLLRAFPIDSESTGRTVSRTAVWEYMFTRAVSLNDYDTSVDIEMNLPAGDYSLMVWADFVKSGKQENYFYAPDDFAEIILHGEHKANTDMRDAFHGSTEVVATRSSVGNGTIVVKMERPLAKFTFLTTDLQEFIDKEETKAEQNASARGETYTRGVDLDDYRVIFYYTGFMPCAYNMFTGKPNDSKTGVSFESTITAINDSEASMGFDYVFVNGTESSASLIIALYNKEGKELFASNPIEVPIKRSQHTIMRGEFLTIETSGGVGIVPDFDGEYNYQVKY